MFQVNASVCRWIWRVQQRRVAAGIAENGDSRCEVDMLVCIHTYTVYIHIYIYIHMFI